MDDDLETMSRETLIREVKRLRAGVREHRDSSAHDLCWHHPKLWGLVPEKIEPEIAVPPWPKFLRGCVHYRQSLDAQAPGAAIADVGYDETAHHANTGAKPAVKKRSRGQGNKDA